MVWLGLAAGVTMPDSPSSLFCDSSSSSRVNIKPSVCRPGHRLSYSSSVQPIMMASDSHNYPYPCPTAAQQLEQQLAGGAIAAAAAAADLERDLQNQAEHDGVDSPSHQPVVDNVNATSPKRTVPAKRKQSDRHSNRGVANLTPEQLVKKRRNDREAQRAIRERTKTKIETLEARITELEGQQPYRELQIAIRARDAVIAENEELKQKLTTFIGSVTNYTNPPSAAAAAAAAAHGLDHLALATSRQEPLPVSEAQAYDDALVVHENEDNESRHLDPHLRHDAGQPHATDDANDHALTPLTDQHDAFPIHFQYQNDDEMDQVFRSTIPEDNLRHSLTTNLVDDTTTIFQHPAVSALDSDVAADFDLISWNVKRLLDSVSHNEGDPLRLLERNAYFCSFFFLLRWLRQPDKYTLDSVPDFLRPTSLQQTKPHSACLDLVPW